MLLLNDDCLEHICKQLSFEDQISTKKVCRLLDRIIHRLWHLQCKNVTLWDLDDLGLSDDEFIDFMTTISNTVEQVKFESMEAHHLLLLKNLRFPKVLQLNLKNLKCDNNTDNNIGESDIDFENDDDDWRNEYRIESQNNDEVVLLMSQLFPNLQTLKIYAKITGKYIDRFTQLIDLDLSHCDFLRTSNFEAIFSTLRLRKFYIFYCGYLTVLDRRIEAITNCLTLEELKIDDHHLVLIIDKLLEMPHLKKIICYTRDYDEILIGRIADCKAKTVEMFLTNDVLWSKDILVEYLSKMINMKKLVFYDDDFEVNQMVTLARELQKLQHVCMRKCRLKGYNEVLPFVEYCKDLSILDISGNHKIDNKFIFRIMEALEKQMYRHSPLELRCFDTNIDEDLLNLTHQKSSKNLLKLNKTECEKELPTISRIFQCNFSTFD